MSERGTMRLPSNVLFLLVAIAVLFLGALRLAVGGGPERIDTAAKAMMWARCFGQRAHIPENVNVDVAEFDNKASGKGSLLEFTATGPVQIDVDDTTLGNIVNAAAHLRKGALVRVEKASGSFELASAHGQLLLVRKDDVSGLLDGPATRFAPATDTTYEINLLRDETVGVVGEGDQRKITLRPGATGSLSIATSQALTTLGPLDAEPWLLGAGTITQVVSATAGAGLDQVIIQAKRQGGQPGAGATTLLACVNSPAVDAPLLIGAAVSSPHGAETGTVSVSVPNALLTAFPQFVGSVSFALASPDGNYAAIGSYTAVDRIWSATISSIFTVALFAWLLNLRSGEIRRRHRERHSETLQDDWSRWASGLFIGPEDNDPSLSLFQMFFWTVITVWGLAFVFIATGSLLTLTTQMMVLLGIAGTGSVLARAIAQSSGKSTSATANAADAPNLANFKFWQILSTKGQFDLLKLQTFVFTLLIGTYVVWRIGEAGAFPSLDANTLLLMGVSQSVYIGGKLASTSSSTMEVKSLQIAIDLQDKKAALQDLKDEEADLKKRKDQSPLSDAEQARLDALPALEAAQQGEIDKQKAQLEEVKKSLGV